MSLSVQRQHAIFLAVVCLVTAMYSVPSLAFVSPRRSMSAKTYFPSSPIPAPTTTSVAMDIVGVSPEPIHTMFSFATFGPQPFWLLMILLPNTGLTKRVMGSLDVIIFFALVHLFIVVASIAQPGATAPLAEFNNVFDPGQDNQAAFMNMVM